MDVSIGDGTSAASRFASYTTAASLMTGSQSKAEEDIPEWKRAMLDRRQKEKEKEEEEAKSRNFGFIPGTTLHSSYVTKSYEQDSRLSSWGSGSNLRSGNSSSYTNLSAGAGGADDDTGSSYKRRETAAATTPTASTTSSSWSRTTTTAAVTAEKPESDLSPYEKYLKRKKEQEVKDEEDKRRSEDDEKKRARDEERRREDEAEREKARKREREREQKRLDEEKRAEEERKKKAAAAEAATTSTTTAKKWGVSAKQESPAPAASRFGAGTTTAAAAAPVDEAVVKRRPWEKPSAAAKSTLPSLNEIGPKASAAASSARSTIRKTSESDSDKDTSFSVQKGTTSSASHSDSDHDTATSNKPELEALKNELKAVKTRNEVLEKIHNEKSKSNPLTLDSAKASEATAELMKAREKVREQETQLSIINKDKKAFQLKIKELESALERRPQVSETQKTISELQTKLKFIEKKCEELTHENDDLRGNVQNLEVELEEVQDNFREDEADEYRSLKRELENSAKNCRVLQFKLKKSEKSLIDLQQEKSEMEAKMKNLSGGSSALDNLNKIRNLEKELESKTMQLNRVEAEVKGLRSGGGLSGVPRRGGPGPCLSRTGSVERNVEDQLLKDLQDSIERETDLKEQLSMAEEETAEMRKKLSRLEDENESLANQVKKMTAKSKTASRRSPSPYSKTNSIEKDEGISEDGEELTPAELKVQLEVSEGETALLRKKVENLLTENLKLTKEVKDITNKLSDEKKRKTSTSSSMYGAPAKENSNTFYEKKVEELQTEVNTFRVKLIEKDRELERLDAQLKATSKGAKTLKRSGSQDEDLLKKLNVIEKEAEVLRNKTAELEAENDGLKSEVKKLQGGSAAFTKKPPASTQEKLQMDKFALEEKVKGLEGKLRDATKKITELEDTSRNSMKINLEMDRLKRDKVTMEAELSKLKDSTNSEKRKMEKLERDLATSMDKAEKAQREIIAAEREKRKSEEERSRLETQVSRLETDIRSLTKEKDRYKEESDQARQKNRENLTQTQEGMKAFKDQIEILKQELSDEKRSNRDLKRQIDDKIRTSETEVSNLRRELDRKNSDVDDKLRKVKDLEDKVLDIEDKLAKSKRINQQRKDKIEKLEAQAESTSNLASSQVNSSQLQSKLEAAEDKIQDLERQMSSKTNGTSTWEVTTLRKELDTLKAENKSLTEKHEQLEEEYVIMKAKLSSNEDTSTLKGELTTLRHTYNTKSDEWIKEKLELERQIKELEASIRSSAGNGWDVERNRFKSILDDRDSQITSLKIECDVSRSQHASAKKELEDIRQKLQDYEKMNRYGRSANGSSSTSGTLDSDTANQLDDLKKQLANEQKERKSDLNNTKMKYDSKIAIMTEEIHALKSQASKYRRERETYKEMFEGVQKKLTDNKSGKIEPGDTAAELNVARAKISDMSYQLHVMEDELSDSKMEAAKAHANMIAHKSNFEIQIAELNSKINELEEEALIDSGRARIAGTRTKMELAWQKERESQKKLINELNTMARDLKSTLLEVEKEKERDRIDSKRKIEAMKRAFDEEQEDTKKQITDLQYDLLELRDAHAKLRTTNEKLRRDKDRSVDDLRFQVGLF